MPSAIGHIRAGKLKPIAVTTAQRFAAMPDLVTISEAGVPGYEAETWFGMFVPVGTPKDVVSRLNADTVKVLKQPELIQQLSGAGLQVRTSTPDQCGAFTRMEVEKWAKVVKAANMRAD
jgi:tripartite-type tricarboxylate transporter receptor subunit TctC